MILENFKTVETNYSGRLSHVSSQPVMIPSSRSMLNRDKRFAAWYMESNLDYRKMFLEITFLRLLHPEMIQKELKLTTYKETEKQSQKQELRRLYHGTIPMLMFASRPLTTSSTIPVELPQSHKVGQQRQRIVNHGLIPGTSRILHCCESDG